MNEQQISELEIKVAFLEQAIQDLSEEFLAQQKDLIKLKSQFSTLSSKLELIESDRNQGSVVDERPPHY